jgi:hypothetical protein
MRRATLVKKTTTEAFPNEMNGSSTPQAPKKVSMRQDRRKMTDTPQDHLEDRSEREGKKKRQTTLIAIAITPPNLLGTERRIE